MTDQVAPQGGLTSIPSWSAAAPAIPVRSGSPGTAQAASEPKPAVELSLSAGGAAALAVVPAVPSASPGSAPEAMASGSIAAVTSGGASASASASAVQISVDKETGIYCRTFSDPVTHRPVRQDPGQAELADAKRMRVASQAKDPARELQISVDRDTGIYRTRYLDPITRRVLSQSPPDQDLAMARQLRAASGVDGDAQA